MTHLNLGPDYLLEGEDLSIVKFPAAVLKINCEKVELFDSELSRLAKNMLFTMYRAPGLGLAAPQVGKSVNIFCIDTEFEREKVTASDGGHSYKYSNFNPLVMVNPIIKEASGEVIHQEGCLSFPGIFEDVKRAEKIVVEFNSLDGKVHQLNAEAMLSICIQHEIDHLKGVVFIERLSQLKKAFLLKKFSKKKKKGVM